ASQFRGGLGTNSRNAAISATLELKPGNAQAKPCEHQQPDGRRPLFRGWGWRGRCWHRYPGRALVGVGPLLQKCAKGHHLIGHRLGPRFEPNLTGDSQMTIASRPLASEL